MRPVGIIIPYFGAWPEYLTLYLNSSKNLTYVDLHIFTDLEPPSTKLPNVFFHHFSLEEFQKKADQVLGFKINIKDPFKVCDFRPAYGLIFHEYLKDYDYWGWGDLDLIFGNISSHIGEDDLYKYDVWSLRKYWLSGSFCMLRNKKILTELFLKTNDYIEIFTSEENYAFDECGKNYDQLRSGIPIDELNLDHVNMTLLVLNLSKNGHIKINFADRIKEYIHSGHYLMYNDGTITDEAGVEYCIYHFITEKRKPYFKYPNWQEIPKKYYISTTGFYLPDQLENRLWIAFSRKIVSAPNFISHLISRALRKIGKNRI